MGQRDGFVDVVVFRGSGKRKRGAENNRQRKRIKLSENVDRDGLKCPADPPSSGAVDASDCLKRITDLLSSGAVDASDCLKCITDLLSSGVVDASGPDKKYRKCKSFKKVRSGCLPRRRADAKGLLKLMKFFWEYNSNPNATDSCGVTLAHLAADTGSALCLKQLIRFGADVNAATKRLGKIVQGSRVPTLIALLSSTHYPYDEYSSPLHLAAQRNHLECVKLLLDHGANINAVNIKQQTPLYLAAKKGHPECVMMLLQNKSVSPHISTPTHTGDVALIQCFRHGEKMRECIKEMVYRGADLSYCNEYGISAVQAALYADWDMDMMRLLIVEGHWVDFDKTGRRNPVQRVMDWQVRYHRHGRLYSSIYHDLNESAAILLLRMGVTGKDLKELLWRELNLPKPPGDLLQTLMDCFAHLPAWSALAAEFVARLPTVYAPPSCQEIFLPEQWTIESITQEKEKLQRIVDEKKSYYHQRSREVPSLAHLSRAAIRSYLQADVRKVISWPVSRCLKRYILLDYDYEKDFS